MTDHDQASANSEDKVPLARRWLSKDLASLILDQKRDPRPFDVVIVGSGYGGAMAAAELAGCTNENGDPVRICVLERGKEYLPGAFPSSLAELPAHVRYTSARSAHARGPWDGLFDLRLGTDVTSLIASGLGGGSLINGAVMEVPDWDHFNSRFPPQVIADLDAPFYSMVQARLGAHKKQGDDYEILEKTAALRKLSRAPDKEFKLAALCIADPERISEKGRPGARLSQANVPLNPCLNCGDCMTGCNVGARESLDTNLLVQARSAGAEIYTGAAVVELLAGEAESGYAAWKLQVEHTDEAMRKREPKALLLKAARVILAAGTFGSTEILMRSTSSELRFSPRLGQQFSCNGDNIALVYGGSTRVNAVADEHQPFHSRKVGPTITGIVEVPADASHQRFLMQEFAVPAALKRLFEEVATTASMLHRLDTTGPAGASSADPCAVDKDAIASSSLIGFIGHDSALGTLVLPGDQEEGSDPERLKPGEGVLQARWPGARNEATLSNNIRQLALRVQDGAQVVPNPLWMMLPGALSEMVDQPLGPVLTVHPLGGCAMAESPARGVVNEWGQVYRIEVNRDGSSGKEPDEPNDVWKSLVVLDGSIIPSSLGANPALTIAALALRSVTHLRQDWGFKTAAPAPGDEAVSPRPRARSLQQCQPRQGAPTEVRLVERLRGTARLEVAGKKGDYMVELTLRFKPKPLGELFGPGQKILSVDSDPDGDEAPSRLRLFSLQTWSALRLEFADDAARDRAAEAIVPLSGTLRMLERDPGNWLGALRALLAWGINRGGRDTLQSYLESVQTGSFPSITSLLKKMWPLARRAGEVRRFDYLLQVQEQGGPFRKGDVIAGGKRFTYGRRANPFRQLAQMQLSRFPYLCLDAPAVLKLDLRFLAREKLPLLRVTAQANQVSAMADFFAFGMYLARLMLGIHLWSFRRPDDPSNHRSQRFPGALIGLPQPEFVEIALDRTSREKVMVRLTNYPCRGGPPLVLIHGYSASSLTFAHPAIPLNMAQYFHQRGRDIWILDLRTSSAMRTAQHKWDFEDAALADIPVAIAHISQVTGKKVDVFAHCIGAVMLSMALLTRVDGIAAVTADFGRPDGAGPKRFRRELKLMQASIRSVILSQKGPALAYTEDSVLRAYLMAYLRRALLPGDYQFRRGPNPSLAEQLLDRLLSVLPYPEEEFDIENPPWPLTRRTPWVGTRHRMGALYGRDFSVRNISDTTLAHIDDLFGDLNLDTVSQTAFMARFDRIANGAGECNFLSRANLQHCWAAIPTMSIHGAENGLADIKTLTLMRDAMNDAQVPFRTMRRKNYGHVDMLIGRDAARDVFPGIERFLKRLHVRRPGRAAEAAPGRAPQDQFDLPWLGPRIFPDGHGEMALWVALDPATPAAGIVCVPVVDGGGGHYAVAGNGPLQVEYPGTDRAVWRKVAWPSDADTGAADTLLVLQVPEAQAARVQDGTVAAPAQEVDVLADAILFREKIQAHLKTKTVAQFLTAAVTLKTWERAVLALKSEGPAQDAAVTIAFGSCQYPTGLFDRPLAEQSLQRLDDCLQRAEATGTTPSLLLLLGDQVYVDATAGMLDPTRRDAQYLQPYQDFYRMAPLRAILREIPMRSILDDHEIIDNWEPTAKPRIDKNRLDAGRKAYWRWQRPGSAEDGKDLYFHFSHFGVPVFMADTRSSRTLRKTSTLHRARILGPRQMRRLRAWLLVQHREAPDRPKLIAGPAMLLPRRLGAFEAVPEDCLRSDGWDGYPASLHQLLGFIACCGIRNVIFISGDEHLANVACIDVTPPGREPVRIHSVHTGALYAPIPFANALPTDFRADERFGFDFLRRGPFGVRVQTRFVEHGDGYTELAMRRTALGWEVWCRFRQTQDEEVVLIRPSAAQPAP